MLFDEASARVIREATRVEVIRLRGEIVEFDGKKAEYFTARAKRGEESIAGFAVAYRGGDLDTALRAKLIGLASKKESFHAYEGIKLCGGFAPKIVFRFWRGGRASTDLLFCFNRSDLGVVRTPSTKPAARLVPTLSDMDPNRTQWLEIVKAALPHDEAIQAYRSED